MTNRFSKLSQRGRLSRRAMLTAGAAATATAALPAPAISQGRRQWRMVTAWPKNFPGLGTGAQRITDSIAEMSEGALAIKLYAAGELVPAFEIFDAVRQGTAEMGHAAAADWTGKSPF